MKNDDETFLFCRVDTELQVEVKFIPRQQQLTKICRHLHQVHSNLGDIQILPKTSSILSIISNGQPIQVSYWQLFFNLNYFLNDLLILLCFV